jgi:hypothetical protein
VVLRARLFSMPSRFVRNQHHALRSLQVILPAAPLIPQSFASTFTKRIRSAAESADRRIVPNRLVRFRFCRSRFAPLLSVGALWRMYPARTTSIGTGTRQPNRKGTPPDPYTKIRRKKSAMDLARFVEVVPPLREYCDSWACLPTAKPAKLSA